MISIPWIFQNSLFARYSKKASEETWHARLGHPQSKILLLLSKKNKLVDVNSWLNQPNVCRSCELEKSCKLPFTLCFKHINYTFSENSLWSLGTITYSFGAKVRYYIAFIDDLTRFTWLYPLRKKCDFYPCCLKFQKTIKINFHKL